MKYLLIPDAVVQAKNINSAAKIIYAAMMDALDGSAVAEMSITDIARNTGLAASTVAGNLRKLVLREYVHPLPDGIELFPSRAACPEGIRYRFNDPRVAAANPKQDTRPDGGACR